MAGDTCRSAEAEGDATGVSGPSAQCQIGSAKQEASRLHGRNIGNGVFQPRRVSDTCMASEVMSTPDWPPL